MKNEINSAANFLLKLVQCRSCLTPEELGRFSDSLRQVLASRYSDHWFPDKPFKGSAFRCIRIVNCRMDPVLATVASTAGISESRLLSVLPSELTLWVDPNEVCYRFGEDGSIGNLFSGLASSSHSDSYGSSGSYQDCGKEIHMKHSDLVQCASTTAIAV